MSCATRPPPAQKFCVPITCHCTPKKLCRKRQFVCNVMKTSGGAGCFFFQEAGLTGQGGHVSLFEGGGWHKALVVGSVSLWRRLLASHP